MDELRLDEHGKLMNTGEKSEGARNTSPTAFDHLVENSRGGAVPVASAVTGRASIPSRRGEC